jgi:hypothetical protein
MLRNLSLLGHKQGTDSYYVREKQNRYTFRFRKLYPVRGRGTTRLRPDPTVMVVSRTHAYPVSKHMVGAFRYTVSQKGNLRRNAPAISNVANRLAKQKLGREPQLLGQ